MTIESFRFTTPADDSGEHNDIEVVKDGVTWFTSRGSDLWNEVIESGLVGEAYVAPPVDSANELQKTDRNMARIGEDLIVALIEKGTLAKSDFEQEVIDKLNARRALRGLTEL